VWRSPICWWQRSSSRSAAAPRWRRRSRWSRKWYQPNSCASNVVTVAGQGRPHHAGFAEALAEQILQKSASDRMLEMAFVCGHLVNLALRDTSLRSSNSDAIGGQADMRAADFTSRAGMGSLCTGDRGARKNTSTRMNRSRPRDRRTRDRLLRAHDSDGTVCVARNPPAHRPRYGFAPKQGELDPQP